MRHSFLTRGLFVALAAVLVAAGSGRAQEVPSQRLLRLADYYSLVQISEPEVAPDGARVVFTRTAVDHDADTRSDSIWSVNLDGSDLRLLVEAGSHPDYSPDGRLLAYLHEGQIWLLPGAGGEPWQLTRMAEGISGFDWAPDGRRLVVAAGEAPALADPVLPAEEMEFLTAAPESAEVQSAAPPPAAPAPLDAGEWVPAEAPETAAIDDVEEAESEGGAAREALEAGAETTEPVVDDIDFVRGSEGENLYPLGEYLAPVAPEEPEVRRLPRVITRLQFKEDGQGYVGVRPQHLFVVEVPADNVGPVSTRRLTGSRFSDGAPRWSPAGEWIAFTSNRTQEPDVNNSVDLWVVSAGGGLAIRVTDDEGTDGSPSWSPDGTHLVYRHTPADPPVYANDQLRLVAIGAAPTSASGAVPPVEVGDPVSLTEGLDRPLASAAQWSADRASVYATLQDRGTVSLVQVSTGLPRLPAEGRRGRSRPAPSPPAGTAAAIIAGPRAVSDFAVLPGGSGAVAVMSAGNAPPELYRVPMAPRAGGVPMLDPSGHVRPQAVPPSADLVPLTAINAAWSAAVAFAAPEPLRYNSSYPAAPESAGPEGDSASVADLPPTDDASGDAFIEGWLLRPPGYREGLRYPLLVRIHGGPVAQFDWAFSFERQWLASLGYAVLYVNPRGSSGYGQDFAVSLWADWGGPDLHDVLAGVDHLVTRGIADPARVGVGGWSYGGILTNYLITRTDRFAAAISGASEGDYFACYGTDDLQRWWEDELGLPYEARSRELYERLSPIRDVARVETPTLFLVGAEDQRVPAAQSEQFYAQLRRRMVDGGPLTGLIVYPDESHGISRPSFVIDRWRRYEAWFDLHLRNDASADPFFGLRAW